MAFQKTISGIDKFFGGRVFALSENIPVQPHSVLRYQTMLTTWLDYHNGRYKNPRVYYRFQRMDDWNYEIMDGKQYSSADDYLLNEFNNEYNRVCCYNIKGGNGIFYTNFLDRDIWKGIENKTPWASDIPIQMIVYFYGENENGYQVKVIYPKDNKDVKPLILCQTPYVLTRRPRMGRFHDTPDDAFIVEYIPRDKRVIPSQFLFWDLVIEKGINAFRNYLLQFTI